MRRGRGPRIRRAGRAGGRLEAHHLLVALAALARDKVLRQIHALLGELLEEVQPLLVATGLLLELRPRLLRHLAELLLVACTYSS